MIDVREVTDPNDPALVGFGEIQQAVYFDQGSLVPPRWFGPMLSDQGGARRNFIVVAERGGRVLGGALVHYLAEADSGFSSFMGVAREARGQGISRALHEKRFEVLNAAAGHEVDGVFIDVVSALLRLAAVAVESAPIRKLLAASGVVSDAVIVTSSVVPSGMVKVNFTWSPTFGLVAPRSTDRMASTASR